jgi:hypothetical protein
MNTYSEVVVNPMKSSHICSTARCVATSVARFSIFKS